MAMSAMISGSRMVAASASPPSTRVGGSNVASRSCTSRPLKARQAAAQSVGLPRSTRSRTRHPCRARRGESAGQRGDDLGGHARPRRNVLSPRTRRCGSYHHHGRPDRAGPRRRGRPAPTRRRLARRAELGGTFAICVARSSQPNGGVPARIGPSVVTVCPGRNAGPPHSRRGAAACSCSTASMPEIA